MPQGKIELLNAICESPGWEPAQPVSSSVEAALRELLEAGWIVSRLDGWEASPKALECYPHFYVDDEGKVQGDRTIGPPPQVAEQLDQVTTLPTISLHSRQRIEAAVKVGSLKGSLVLINEAIRGERVEVEVQLRVRRVDP